MLVFLAACAGVEVRFDPSPSCSYRDERAAAPEAPDGGAAGVEPNLDVTHLAAGQHHACAAIGGDEVLCWGGNELGQLSSRIDVPPGESWLFEDWWDITDLAAGGAHTCVTTDGPDETVVCWGNNAAGQLGVGNREPQAGIVRAAVTAGATQVAAGLLHTCAVIDDVTTRVACWGDNRFGQLGVEDPGCCTSATNVQGLPEPLEEPYLIAGAFHTCVATFDGMTVDLWCWGDDRYGALGDGEAGGHRAAPVRVELPAPLGYVAAGAHHTCAALGDHTVYCWGRNESGELGDGTTESRASPGPALHTRHVQGITAGGSFLLDPNSPGEPLSLDGSGHTCVLDQTGQTVWCWGANDRGQLGNGTTTDSSMPVRALLPMEIPFKLAAGGAFTCAYSLAGRLSCWGATDSGQLGYVGEPSPMPVPVTVLR